jgi:hypothetical protein
VLPFNKVRNWLLISLLQPETTSFEKISPLVNQKIHATEVLLNFSVNKQFMKFLSKILIILVLIGSCKKIIQQIYLLRVLGN